MKLRTWKSPPHTYALGTLPTPRKLYLRVGLALVHSYLHPMPSFGLDFVTTYASYLLLGNLQPYILTSWYAPLNKSIRGI